MTKVLPETAGDVVRQVAHYEWLKQNFPGLYVRIVELAEQRLGGGR